MVQQESSIASELPPTVIVVHPREKRSKCSVEPLRGRPDFAFWTFPNQGQEPIDGYVRLGMGGELLNAEDSAKGLLVLDGTWKLAEKMEPFYSDMPVKSIPSWQTAYPRVSKLWADPSSGLATIEAIFAAYICMNRDTTGLLDSYYWAEEFVTKNQSFLLDSKTVD
jgi:pre-rRNA-processing protein TSR3